MMEYARRTPVTVIVDGTDITADITPFLDSVTYTDNEDGATDDLQLSLNDRDAIWISSWLTEMIEAAYDASKNMTLAASIGALPCGTYEIDSVSYSAPPSKVTIKATSLPYVSSIRQQKKSQSWEKYTLKGIAEEIASRNGLTVEYIADRNPNYDRTEQSDVSDIAFLAKLCADVNLALKVTDGKIVIFSKSDYELRAPVAAFIRGGGSYSSVKLGTAKGGKYTSCRVSYVKPDGNVIEGIAYTDKLKESKNRDAEDKQRLEIKQRVTSAAEAEQLAADTLERENQIALSASVSTTGSPSLVAGNCVSLGGFGAWSGKHVIEKASHKASTSGGYTVDLTLRKVPTAAPSSDGGQGAAVGMSEDEINRLALECIRGDWGNGEDRKNRLTQAGYDYGTVQRRVNELMRG